MNLAKRKYTGGSRGGKQNLGDVFKAALSAYYTKCMINCKPQNHLSQGIFFSKCCPIAI